MYIDLLLLCPVGKGGPGFNEGVGRLVLRLCMAVVLWS